VIPGAFHEFFLASAGVAGALIGLLFVAISVAPERLLSEHAALSHRVRASTALTTFSNALTVSLFALIPGVGVGGTASSVAVVGLLFVAGSLIALLRVRRTQPGELRDAGFLVGVLIVFVLQLWFGLRIETNDNEVGAVRGICVMVVVCFLVGIARSWELIGGPSFGLANQLFGAPRRPDGGKDDE
jgi:hypothetical protein